MSEENEGGGEEYIHRMRIMHARYREAVERKDPITLSLADVDAILSVVQNLISAVSSLTTIAREQRLSKGVSSIDDELQHVEDVLGDAIPVMMHLTLDIQERASGKLKDRT